MPAWPISDGFMSNNMGQSKYGFLARKSEVSLEVLNMEKTHVQLQSVVKMS